MIVKLNGQFKKKNMGGEGEWISKWLLALIPVQVSMSNPNNFHLPAETELEGEPEAGGSSVSLSKVSTSSSVVSGSMLAVSGLVFSGDLVFVVSTELERMLEVTRAFEVIDRPGVVDKEEWLVTPFEYDGVLVVVRSRYTVADCRSKNVEMSVFGGNERRIVAEVLSISMVFAEDVAVVKMSVVFEEEIDTFGTVSVLYC